MLKCRNLKISYKEDKILDEVNFDIYEGQVFCITGASGSGKSSLLKAINGMIPEINVGEVSGEIRLNEIMLNEMDISKRSNYVSTVFQNPKTQFYCIDTTDELAFPLENRNQEKEEIQSTIERYTKILKTEKLLNRNIFSLSGGEKQLMAITSVMTMENQLYLFDEPSASLDYRSIELLKNAIVYLKQTGKMVLIAEHRLYYLMDVIDNLAILKEGKMEIFSKEELSDEKMYNLKEKYFLRNFRRINKKDLWIDHSYYRIHLLNKANNIEEENPILKCEKFIQEFQHQKILDMENIGFSNEIYFIIGDNGVGKSTFIKRMAKLLKGKGKSYYDDREIKRSYEYISMVMQDVNYQIFTESIWSEISIVSDDDEKKEKVLRELKLYDKKEAHPQSLSGGEKQRLMIALAIVSSKPIVILDEPTSGLCKGQMRSIIGHLKKMKREGKVVIVITHDYELIKMCDGVIYEFLNERSEQEDVPVV